MTKTKHFDWLPCINWVVKVRENLYDNGNKNHAIIINYHIFL